MDFPEPKKGQFTVYSKSGCINCVNVKTILKEKKLVFNVVDCDEFILETKKELLSFIQTLIGQEYNKFPIDFDNNKFIGGYNDTIKYVKVLQEQLLNFDSYF